MKAVTLCLISWLTLSACTSTLEFDRLRHEAGFVSKSAHVADVPFYPQTEYQCGPASLAMMLQWSGIETNPEQLTSLVYVPGRKGSFQVEMKAATRQFGRIPYVIKPTLQSLIEEIEAGFPVLVFQNLGLSWFPRWHYAVVTGVDIPAEEIYLHTGTHQQYTMALDTFERTWLRAEKWAMLTLKPGQIASSATPAEYLKAVVVFEKKNNNALVDSAYEAAVQRWPDDVSVHMAQANFHYQQNRFSSALMHYREAIRIDEKYAPAHNNIAQVLFELNDKHLAYDHAKRAVEIGGKYLTRYQQTLNNIESSLANTPQ